MPSNLPPLRAMPAPGRVDLPGEGTEYPASGTIKAPVVVFGAHGAVGRSTALALLEAGYPVIAAGLRDTPLAVLRAQAGDLQNHLTTLPGSFASEDEGRALAAALQRLSDPPRHVVAHLPASLERCRLLDRSAAFLHREMERRLLPHFIAARHLLPLLGARSGGSYLIVDGPGATFPWAGYAHRSMASAAVRMLALALHDEAYTFAVRLRLLSLATPVRDVDSDCDCPEWPTAADVGRRVVALLRDTTRSTEVHMTAQDAPRPDPQRATAIERLLTTAPLLTEHTP